MALVEHLVVLLHLIGFAALFGGLLVQVRVPDPEINGTALAGAWTMLITGLGLVAIAEFGDTAPDHLKIGIKLFLTLLVLILVARNRRFQSIPKGLWALISAMTLANAAIAVLWQ